MASIMTNMANIASMPAAVQTFYDRTLLERALPKLVHAKFGDKKPFKSRSGNTIKFRRYNSLAIGALLTEGVTPGLTAVTYAEVTATLAQYGALIGFSDMVELTNQDAILAEHTALLGEQMGLTEDTILRNTLVGGSNVFYAGSVATRLLTVAKINGPDLDKIHRAMRKANADYFYESVTSSPNVQTQAIRPAFAVIVHPDTTFDLESITGYKSFADYPQGARNQVDPTEIGMYKNFRFFESTNASIFPGATGVTAAVASTGMKATGGFVDIYQTLIFAKHAYGICPLSEGTQKLIVHKPGSGVDYLEQMTIAGWKLTTTFAILNDAFMCRYEHCATA